VPAQWIETREVPVAELSRFPGNARRGDVEAIRQSIARNGQYRAIVVRKCDDGMVILAGNHTYDAIKAEGHPTARCEVITCTDDEARRINLADNRYAELGSYEQDDLAELLRALDGDFEGSGWDAEALASLDALLTPPDLDDLAKELGDPGEDDTWPSARIRAPHHVAAAWNDHLAAYSDDAAAAFAQSLGVELTA